MELEQAIYESIPYLMEYNRLRPSKRLQEILEVLLANEK